MPIAKTPWLLCALAACSGSALAADAARDYPNRPIRMVVTNAPGSSVDTLSRIVAAKLGERFGHQVVIDNRPGAGSVLGMEIAKNANPDGYTLVSAPTAAVAIAPVLHRNVPFDVVNDFAYISLFAVTPNVLVVYPGLPVKSVKELIDYSKTKSGQINMASAGPGSQSHLAGALLTSLGKFPALHVPYKGGGASVAAVVGNESQWTMTPAPAVWSLVKSGRLRALAHSLPKKSALLGDLPPVADTIAGYDYSGWQGLLAPARTPKAIQDRIHQEMLKVMALPEVRDALAAQATDILTATPDEFRRLAREEIAKYAKVIKAIGLKVE